MFARVGGDKMSDSENLKDAARSIVCADNEKNPYFAIEDIEKAIIYLKREIKRREDEIEKC
jgi:hypothetical protein